MTPDATILTQLAPRLAKIITARPVGGGCISEAWKVSLADGSTLLAKTNSLDFLANFQAECEGLAAIREATAENKNLRVPTPIVVGPAGGRAWLLMQWIESSPNSEAFFERFGKGLARFHADTVGTQIGWHGDNYLGSAHQVNTSATDWPSFVAHSRIGFQLRWALDQGSADATLIDQCEAIIRTMSSLLSGREDATSLLHGDLWSGNYMADETGTAVLIDPAVYYGCREAEFGMLRLFGGCPRVFFDAYQSEFPMADGWQRRVGVYVLYHLLNHLNLFGHGYLSQCHAAAADLLRS